MRADIRETLDAWAATGRPVGSFVRAVLENDLVAAVCRADSDNLHDLVEIVKYVYNYLPSGCWGSPEKVRGWAERKAQESRQFETRAT